ncbi:MAG TPA: AraC family transcriptional regulator [Pyrinomonadaceae bacterium]|nr:AraC family transcriptional regulator [Pyrinomonadaceae bacterium]
MNFLRTGHYFGQTNTTIHLNGITLTDTVIEAQEHIDWHFHENAYFTLILQGKLIEVNKKEKYYCKAGSLLFHSPQEPHYNVKLEDNTKFFNIEFDKNCFDDFAFDANALHGSFSVENPDIKLLLYKAFRETKNFDDVTVASIQMLLSEILRQMLRFKRVGQNTKPRWTNKLKEILHDTYAEKISLINLSNELSIHPAHLSRDFSKHFHCTFGEYVRKLRVEKSLAFLPNKNLSLTEIAFQCGFADQSHFLRCFKQIIGTNPNAYRKFLLC